MNVACKVEARRSTMIVDIKEKNSYVPPGLESGKGLLLIGRLDNLEAQFTQAATHELAQARLGVYDQNGRILGSRFHQTVSERSLVREKR
jgi:hypothetical protein